MCFWSHVFTISLDLRIAYVYLMSLRPATLGWATCFWSHVFFPSRVYSERLQIIWLYCTRYCKQPINKSCLRSMWQALLLFPELLHQIYRSTVRRRILNTSKLRTSNAVTFRPILFFLKLNQYLEVLSEQLKI